MFWNRIFWHNYGYKWFIYSCQCWRRKAILVGKAVQKLLTKQDVCRNSIKNGIFQQKSAIFVLVWEAQAVWSLSVLIINKLLNWSSLILLFNEIILKSCIYSNTSENENSRAWQSTLTMLTYNVRSLLDTQRRTSFANAIAATNFDIICITESWLISDVPSSALFL